MNEPEPDFSAVEPKGGCTKIVVRIVLFGLLLLGCGAFAFDWMARTGATGAFDELDQKWHSAEQASQEITPDDVHQLLGRQPDSPVAHSPTVIRETYSWQGIRQRYYVQVLYRLREIRANDEATDDAVLDNISLNSPID